MKTTSLNGKWTLLGNRENGDKISITATVPGTVHTALSESGIIGDMFWDKNADSVSWIEDNSWEYRRDFDITDDYNKLEIEFKGLDTYCVVYVNEEKIASCDNMHITYTLDITEYAKKGTNTVRLVFLPPVAQEKKIPAGECGGVFSINRFYTRRMQCTYGWDWVNRFVTMGIWRDVTLYADRYVKIDCLQAVTEGITAAGATVKLYAKGSHDRRFFPDTFEKRGYHFGTSPMLRFTVKSPGGEVVYTCKKLFREAVVTDYVTIENPELWYPNGYGESPLYALEAIVTDENDSAICSSGVNFGIRDIQIVRRADKIGTYTYDTAKKMFDRFSQKEASENEFESFELFVNNTKIICKGANWVPADPFPGNVSEDKYNVLLSLAKDGNINMLRVWGGGYYEDDIFYDICDRCGIMVQQDFMMACGVYPYSDEYIENPDKNAEKFLKNFERECEDNVGRLTSHPSIVWWNGDNENQMGGNENLINNARRIANGVTEPTLRKYDTLRQFFPSTPWGGVYNNSPAKGLFHGTGMLNLYFDYLKDSDMHDYPEFFGSFISRFSNETPLFSSVAESSLKRFMPPGERSEDSFSCFVYHTKNHPDERYRNFSIFQHMDLAAKKMFGKFRGANDRMYKLGIMGYEWMRTSMEGMRRSNDYMSGNIFWMYNDCWPAVGCSMVDYYGVPKAAYYGFKMTAQKICACVYDDGKGLRIAVSNNSAGDSAAEIALHLVASDRILRTERIKVNTTKNSVSYADVPSGFAPNEGTIIVCDYAAQGVSGRTYYSAVIPSLMKLDRAAIQMDKNGAEITLKADKLAMFVWLDGDFSFDDNCMIMLPGETKKLSCKKAAMAQSDDITLHYLNG